MKVTLYHADTTFKYDNVNRNDNQAMVKKDIELNYINGIKNALLDVEKSINDTGYDIERYNANIDKSLDKLQKIIDHKYEFLKDVLTFDDTNITEFIKSNFTFDDENIIEILKQGAEITHISNLTFGLNAEKSYKAIDALMDVNSKFFKKHITFDDSNLDEVYAYTHGMGEAPKDAEHFEPLTRSTNVNDILVFEREDGKKSVKRYAPVGFEKLPRELALKVLIATGERKPATEVKQSTSNSSNKTKRPKQ